MNATKKALAKDCAQIRENLRQSQNNLERSAEAVREAGQVIAEVSEEADRQLERIERGDPTPVEPFRIPRAK